MSTTNESVPLVERIKYLLTFYWPKKKKTMPPQELLDAIMKTVYDSIGPKSLGIFITSKVEAQLREAAREVNDKILDAIFDLNRIDEKLKKKGIIPQRPQYPVGDPENVYGDLAGKEIRHHKMPDTKEMPKDPRSDMSTEYKAYARCHGRSAEDQLEFDKKEFAIFPFNPFTEWSTFMSLEFQTLSNTLGKPFSMAGYEAWLENMNADNVPVRIQKSRDDGYVGDLKPGQTVILLGPQMADIAIERKKHKVEESLIDKARPFQLRHNIQMANTAYDRLIILEEFQKERTKILSQFIDDPDSPGAASSDKFNKAIDGVFSYLMKKLERQLERQLEADKKKNAPLLQIDRTEDGKMNWQIKTSVGMTSGTADDFRSAVSRAIDSKIEHESTGMSASELVDLIFSKPRVLHEKGYRVSREAESKPKPICMFCGTANKELHPYCQYEACAACIKKYRTPDPQAEPDLIKAMKDNPPIEPVEVLGVKFPGMSLYEYLYSQAYFILLQEGGSTIPDLASNAAGHANAAIVGLKDAVKEFNKNQSRF